MAKIIQLTKYIETQAGHPVCNPDLTEQKLEIARASCEHVLADLQAVLAVLATSVASTIALESLPSGKQSASD